MISTSYDRQTSVVELRCAAMDRVFSRQLNSLSHHEAIVYIDESTTAERNENIVGLSCRRLTTVC
jgi:hypothetical protein